MGYVLSDDLPDVKVCPFCGREPALQKDTRYPRPECNPADAYEIVCNTYGCVLYHVDNNYWLSPEEAIKAWNTRYTSDDLISRSNLLAAYDAAHQGPPGGARKLIENAPAVL